MFKILMYNQKRLNRQLKWQKNSAHKTWNIKSRPQNQRKNLAAQKQLPGLESPKTLCTHGQRQPGREGWIPVPARMPRYPPCPAAGNAAQAGWGTGKRDTASERRKRISWGSQRFFRCQLPETCKRQGMMFSAIKTGDGAIKGKISFYCRIRKVSQQEFYKYPAGWGHPWKYQDPAGVMRATASEGKYNGTCGRICMYQVLLLKQPGDIHIPGRRTVCRAIEETGLSHRPKRSPNGIAEADREARKSGNLHVSAIFGCLDTAVPGLAMDTNMKASLCEWTLNNAVIHIRSPGKLSSTLIGE